MVSLKYQTHNFHPWRQNGSRGKVVYRYQVLQWMKRAIAALFCVLPKTTPVYPIKSRAWLLMTREISIKGICNHVIQLGVTGYFPATRLEALTDGHITSYHKTTLHLRCDDMNVLILAISMFCFEICITYSMSSLFPDGNTNKKRKEWMEQAA